jgi:hypothetical protein
MKTPADEITNNPFPHEKKTNVIDLIIQFYIHKDIFESKKIAG